MSDEVKIDTTQLDRLAADLGQVPGNAGKNIVKAIEVTARNVKDEWASKLTGPHLPHAGRAITYDITGSASSGSSEVTAEIGAEKGREQAPIVVPIESGSPHSAPKQFGLNALHHNEADFEHGLDVAIDDALKGLGL